MLVQRLMVGGILCVATMGYAAPFTAGEMADTRPQNSSSHTAETAVATKMPWCTGAKLTGEKWSNDKFRPAIHSYQDFPAWADAAEQLCEHKEDPTWVEQATHLVQGWMNAKENSQADAEKQIGEKIAALKFERSPAGQASAEENKRRFSEHELDVEKPQPGVDTAKFSDKPSWCDVAGKIESWEPGRIHRTFSNKYGIQGTIDAARQICLHPTDATWKVEAGYIAQKWMNWTHQTQAEAEKSLAARIQADKFSGQRDELCKALELGPETAGEEKTYGQAKQIFFGCKNEHQTLWQDQSAGNPTGVGFYLDGDTQPEELMRAYWLFTFVRDPQSDLPSNSVDDNVALLYYAIAQTDFERLDMAAIHKTLNTAPYNDYARTVAAESFAILKARRAAYEAIVTKMTKGDEDYTAILRTAPKAAFARWDKLYTQWKPEIDRSDAFEKLLSKPSRKALKNCSPALFKDGEKLVKSLKTNTYKELVDKMNGDPVANLLFSRLGICYAADKVQGASGPMREVVSKGRDLRGPRSLAYYAIVDAVVEAKKDRPRLLLGLSGFLSNGQVLSGGFEPPGKDFDYEGSLPYEWTKSYNKGVVGAVKKVPEGIEVVFKKVTLKFQDYACTDDTRHPLKIGAGGRIEYYRNCKALGTFSTQDETPKSVVISPLLAAGVKPGAFVQYVEGSGHAKDGTVLGAIVFVKKTAQDKKIDTFFGFGL